MTSRSRRPLLAVLTSLVTALATVGAAAPAGAEPPAKFEAPVTLSFPDFDNGFVVLLNISRDVLCTDERVQFEQDFAAWAAEHLEDFEAWLEAGNDPGAFEPQPPQPPDEPAGERLVSIHQKITGNGAIIEHLRASDVRVEIWRLDEDAPGVGPCLDSASERLVGIGTADAFSNDNDLLVSETRANAISAQIRARLVGGDGESFRYRTRFHISDRCHLPEDGPPVCLVETFELR